MSNEKQSRPQIKRVPVDEDLAGLIGIACTNENEEYSYHDRYVALLAGYQWLVKKMAVSRQFTPEQQAALKVLNDRSEAYRKGEVVEVDHSDSDVEGE